MEFSFVKRNLKLVARITANLSQANGEMSSFFSSNVCNTNKITIHLFRIHSGLETPFVSTVNNLIFQLNSTLFSFSAISSCISVAATTELPV